MVKPTATVSGIVKTEAELSQPVSGAKELLWLKCLLGELGGKGSEVPCLMTWVFEIINGCEA